MKNINFSWRRGDDKVFGINYKGVTVNVQKGFFRNRYYVTIGAEDYFFESPIEAKAFVDMAAVLVNQ